VNIKAGVRAARSYVACEMDADCSHPPWILPRLKYVTAVAQLVISSHYVLGRSTIGWSWKRRLLSRGATLFARLLLGVGIQDKAAGFRCFHDDAPACLVLDSVSAQGDVFQIEMVLRMRRCGYDVMELPIHFLDRKVVDSKMDRKIAVEAMVLIPRLLGRLPQLRAMH
jgi:dolichol-phosphate mannosyltransferase